MQNVVLLPFQKGAASDRRFLSSWRLSTQTVLVMKLTVLLLTAAFLNVSAHSFSQNVSYSGSNVLLGKVFKDVEKQTGLVFFFERGLLEKARPVSITATQMPLTSFLDQLLKDQPFKYSIESKTIIISRKNTQPSIGKNEDVAGLYLLPISGIIRNQQDEPLWGVTVTIKGTKTSTDTKSDGSFLINANIGDILIISSVGYKTVEYKITSGMNYIILEQSATVLDETVIVSTGYKQIKKSTSTGSASVITSKEIEQTPSVNLMERLEGKAAGVKFDVRNNKIQIRGVSGFGSVSVDPLIVIDGFPYIDNQLTNITATNFTPGSNSGTINPLKPGSPAYANNSILSNFNPNDIESITFLKDAAASAIWGAQASNGVIVIVTKKGKKNSAPSISLSTTLSTSAPASLSHLNQMNSKDYIDLEQELFDKGFYADPYTHYRTAPVSEAVDWMIKVRRGEATAAQRDSALNILSGRSNLDQLERYLLQNVVSQQYNLSVSGGGQNSTYYLSGNYTRNNPVFKNNYAESYFITSNMTNSLLNNRITLSSGLNYTYSKSFLNTGALNALSAGTFGLAPYSLLVDENGRPIQRSLYFTQRVADSLQKAGHLSWTYNPLDELNYNNTVYTKNAVRINLSLTGHITSWLNVQVSGQLQRNTDQQDNLQDLNSMATRQLVNEGSVVTNGRLTYNVPKGGVYKTSNANSEDYGLRGQLNVNKSWQGGQHQLQVLAGSEIRQTKGTGYKQTRYGYDPVLSTSVAVNPTVPYSTMYGAAFTRTLGYSDGPVYKNRLRYLSYFSDASYTFLNKYYLSASARFDDASMLGVRRADRGNPLWSVGLRWDMKKEKFMDNISWLNSLSLRGSYGSNGALPQGTSYYTIISTGTDSYTQLPTASVFSYANPTLTWQTTKTLNGGIDAGMFSNRLSVNLDVYTKRSHNIFYNFPYNGTYGFSSVGYNTATLSNHGVEVNLTGYMIRLKDWEWSANFNFSYNTNKVTDNRFDVNTTTLTTPNHISTGYPTDNLFVFRWAGLSALGQPQIYDAKGNKLIANTFPVITTKDQVYVGRTTAPYFGGLSNTVRYKSWTLMARAVYNLGHKFLKQDVTGTHYPTGTQFSGRLSTSRLLVDRWREPGDEAFTNIPGISNNVGTGIEWFNNSNINVRDAGHVRLQQVTLGYVLPTALVPVFKTASINATVSNLGIIWRKNKDGIDPDYIMTGDYNNLPPTRNYVINLNLTF